MLRLSDLVASNSSNESCENQVFVCGPQRQLCPSGAWSQYEMIISTCQGRAKDLGSNTNCDEDKRNCRISRACGIP